MPIASVLSVFIAAMLAALVQEAIFRSRLVAVDGRASHSAHTPTALGAECPLHSQG